MPKLQIMKTNWTFVNWKSRLTPRQADGTSSEWIKTALLTLANALFDVLIKNKIQFNFRISGKTLISRFLSLAAPFILLISLIYFCRHKILCKFIFQMLFFNLRKYKSRTNARFWLFFRSFLHFSILIF